MSIELQAALVSGLVGSLIGVLVTMWQVRKQFQTEAELQRRESRMPVIQKLWTPLQPFSFHGVPQADRKDTLHKISVDLTDWYYKTGGLYLSKTSQDYFVEFQKAMESVMREHEKQRQVQIGELSHKQFHLLQLRASALRSLTARDCGTRVETDSKYGSDAEKQIRSDIENCKLCRQDEG